MQNVPPSADADVALSDGRTLHLRALPLGQMDGTILDGVRFDASGTRAAFLARFDGGSINGDWRRSEPVQAYVADATRHTLVALSDDGTARSIAWHDATHVSIEDGGASRVVFVGSASTRGLGRRFALSPIAPEPAGSLVSPSSVFRLEVYKEDDGSYAIGQVGAVRLRTVGLSQRGRLAVVGSFIAWVDGSRSGGPAFARSGPDDVVPPEFPDSLYGQMLVPLDPLGRAVYQSAYRNGVAYFSFTLGINRIVAATTDFVNYTYPQLPSDPAFTVGDGFGAGADGILYFARPEDGTLQLWKNGRYVSEAMRFPDDASDPARLFDAMYGLGVPRSIAPPVWPESDAFDAAMLEWRVYPLGDVTGRGWIASDLGRLFVAGSDAAFREVNGPAFPFAVLGRTDDGRVWAAAPESRTIHGIAVAHATSDVWSTRDGAHWRFEATVPGDAGAVGLVDGIPWIAFSAAEPDAPGVEVVRLDGSSQPVVGSTGAIYAGEDLQFAELPGGFFLICGAAPGTRSLDDGGPLVALRLDDSTIFAQTPDGVPRLLAERLHPSGSFSPQRSPAPGSMDWMMLDPSLTALRVPGGIYEPTIATSLEIASVPGARVVDLTGEARWESEYAWHPYPFSRVTIDASDTAATVTRTLATGPLAARGQVERWARDRSGDWSLSSVVSRWHD
jgi:hypothetical protein